MDGFSPDGYIIDQNRFTAYRYREMSSDINGCGWIAAYNVLRFLGHGVAFDDVRRGMDAMIRLRIPGPTPTRVLRAYLSRFGRFSYAAGRRRALAAAQASTAGVLRYWEGSEPHFIAFLRRPDGQFRFLNVADGLEDIALPMDAFFADHCRRGPVRVLTADGNDHNTERKQIHGP